MPSDEGRAGDCWTLGKGKADGALPATSDAGCKVRLQRLTYIAAEAETDRKCRTTGTERQIPWDSQGPAREVSKP
jgi:hypothetical protein